MRAINFPYCCTANLIVDFGESAVAAGGNHIVDYDEAVEKLQYYIEWYRNCGHAMLVATTNSDQVTTMKALKACGFTCTKAMSKKQHPETTVKLWWLPLAED